MSETWSIALSEAENASVINIFQIGGAIKMLSWLWFGCHHPSAQKEISRKLAIYSDTTIIQLSPIAEEMSGQALTEDASIPLTITN